MYFSVLGDIAPSELGRTLTHEHLSMQFDVCFVQPEKPELADLDWTLGNYGWIWSHPYRDEQRQNDRMGTGNWELAMLTHKKLQPFING